MPKNEYIELYNQSLRTQFVYSLKDKVRYELPPHTVLAFPEEVANKFLEERSQFVRQYEDSDVPDKLGEPSVWVANGTGNPFLPEDVRDGADRLVPNPLSTPMTLRFEVRQDQVQTSAKSEPLEVMNLPPIQIILPPYRRKRMPISVALCLEGRDSQQSREHVGKLVRCKGPRAFEPNTSWALDDIRLFGKLMNEQMDIEATHPPESEYKDNESAILKAKRAALRDVFFLLIDEAITVPTKEEFEMMKSELAKKVGKIDAPRKPGRPAAQASA